MTVVSGAVDGAVAAVTVAEADVTNTIRVLDAYGVYAVSYTHLAAFIEKQSKRWDVPNSERCVFAQVPNYMVYVVSMCPTYQGLKLYQTVMRAFPKHPVNLEAEHAERAMVERVMKGKI